METLVSWIVTHGGCREQTQVVPGYLLDRIAVREFAGYLLVADLLAAHPQAADLGAPLHKLPQVP